MHLLIITPYYDPDLGPSAPLITMLAKDLVNNGYMVTVLTAVPHYPSGQVQDQYRKYIWKWDLEDGVNICRVRVPSGNRSNLMHRLLTFLVFQILTSLIGVRQKYDTLIVTNPAVEAYLPFWSLGVLRRKPTLYCVWDLYPEAGIRAGIFHNSIEIKLVRWIENYCLSHAVAIQVLSDAFLLNICQRGVLVDKISVILPWLDIEFIKPLPRWNDFSIEYGLSDSLVVMHAGNIGYTQDLDSVLEAAHRLVDDPRIKFVLVGDGPERLRLMQKTRELGLRNLTFIPFQSRQRLPQVLASADLTLVSQKAGFEWDLLPSKLFPALASGRPILAVVSPLSAASVLITQAQAGVCVPPGEPTLLAQQIITLLGDPEERRRMGENGRLFAEQHYSRSQATAQFVGILTRMVS